MSVIPLTIGEGRAEDWLAHLFGGEAVDLWSFTQSGPLWWLLLLSIGAIALVAWLLLVMHSRSTGRRRLADRREDLAHSAGRHDEQGLGDNALAISEQRLSLALEAAQLGIWDFFPKSGQAYFNPTWFTMLGYQPDAFPHAYETWAMLLHPDDRARVEERLGQFICEQGDQFTLEFRMKTARGGWRWIQGIGKTFERDAGGEIIRMSGVHQDITERCQLLSVLEASERRYRDLFNEAPVMYVLTENRQGEAWIIDVNNLFCERLGYARAEVIGFRLADFYTAESVFELIDGGGYLRAMKGEFIAEERTFKTADGGFCHTLLHALPEYDRDGLVYGTRAMFLDITARKQAEMEARRLETALQHAGKMEAIGRLAGGIAHDFNNILGAIIGYSELALHETQGKASLERKLQQVLTAALRARDLVQQILIFSRQDEKILRPLLVAPLIRETLKLLRSTLPTSIEIRQEIGNLQRMVLADPTRIHQIIMNLCTNAAQAMAEEGGVLTVRLSEVQLAGQDVLLLPGLKPGLYHSLEVVDTGPGIPPGILPKIFTPYYTTKEQSGGTGLGLAIVHGIVESFGGSVQVASEPGKGAVFTVLLPTVPEQAIEEIAAREAPRAKGEHILLIDDEEELLEVGESLLAQVGYAVTTCREPAQALDVVSSDPNRFDLVMTDMTMPGLTGDRLAAALRKIRPNLPIILCTGFNETLRGLSLEALQVDALIMKPLRQSEMAETIRSLLDARQG